MLGYTDVSQRLLSPKYTLNCCQDNTPQCCVKMAQRTEGRSQQSSLSFKGKCTETAC